jgi:hypothetical protein
MTTLITDLTELLAMADDDLLVVQDASEVTIEPVKKGKLSTLLAYLQANADAFEVPWTELAVTDVTNGGADDLTAIDFGSIPAGVKDIEIRFDEVSSDSTSSILVQLGTGGSPTTSGYRSASEITSFTNSSTAGFVIFSNLASYTMTGCMRINLFDTNDWVSDHTLGITSSGNSAKGGGRVTLAGTLDNLRITSVSGTQAFDNGQLRVRYR